MHRVSQPQDVQAISQLSFSVPENALETVAGVCGKVLSPLYRYVESTVNADVERLMQSLHEADPEVAASAASCLVSLSFLVVTPMNSTWMIGRRRRHLCYHDSCC